MSQQRDRNKFKTTVTATQIRLTNTYYGILGLHPSASAIAIRRSYRALSKEYHPDTTKLPQSEAKAKFQRLNEAYATLSSPEKRSLYDLQIGYSRVNVLQDNWQPQQKKYSTTAYLDPTDRPLSPGEIFVLVLLGLTFAGCLLLVLAIAYFRGDVI